MTALNQIVVALIFHLLDLVTGLIGAIRQGKLQSSKMRDGMFKKVGFIFCYVLAFLIDNNASTVGLNIRTSILPVIIVYAVTTENICKINPDLMPAKIMSLFQIDKQKEGGDDAEHTRFLKLGN